MIGKIVRTWIFPKVRIPELSPRPVALPVVVLVPVPVLLVLVEVEVFAVVTV
jgi:hypothetical protein